METPVEPNLPSPTFKGLSNEQGHNNCFLNVVIQSLWHLEDFRTTFLDLTDHRHFEQNCLFCELKDILIGYKFSSSTALSPQCLRRTVSEVFSRDKRFQIGAMGDATECLVELVDLMSKATTNTDQKDVKHIFALDQSEHVLCRNPACGAATEPSLESTPVHYVYVREISNIAPEYEKANFGQLIWLAGSLYRRCSNPECNYKNPIVRFINNSPEAMILGMVWSDIKASVFEIANLINLIDLDIDLHQMFDVPEGVTAMAVTYRLKGLICYYGQHYVAIFYVPEFASWIMFDDENIKTLGKTWLDVKKWVVISTMQPSCLFYEKVESHSPESMYQSPNPAHDKKKTRVRPRLKTPTPHKQSGSKSPLGSPAPRGSPQPAKPRVSSEALDDIVEKMSRGLIVTPNGFGHKASSPDAAPVSPSVLQRTPSPAPSVEPQNPSKIAEFFSTVFSSSVSADYGYN